MISKEVLELKKELLEDMLDYIADDLDEEYYSKKDVKTCDKLIQKFIKDLEQLSSASMETVQPVVKDFVLSLNNLNDKCAYNLIETDQREMLCELVFLSVKDTIGDFGDIDLTEEWRDW